MTHPDITIAMTRQIKNRIQEQVNKEAPNEISILIGGNLSKSDTHLRFLVKEVHFPTADDYEIQRPAACRMKPEYYQDFLEYSAENQMHHINAHSHPFDPNSPRESGTDLEAASYMPRAVTEACPGMVVLTMIIGGNFNGLEAHLYLTALDIRVPVDKLVVFDSGKLEVMYPTSSRLRKKDVNKDDLYNSRLALAFGKEALANNENIRVGAIGCGSLGEPVIAQLANLAFKLTIGDMDEFCIENANRSLYGNQVTATRDVSKAELCKRAVLQTNPAAEIRVVEGDIRKEEIQNQFLDCDLLVVTTDNETSRFVANHLAMTHGIVLVDAGTGIIVKDGKLDAVHGQVVKVIPGNNLCHECSDFFDSNLAHEGLLSEEDFTLARSRGYVDGDEMPAPSVLPLNMAMAGITVWEILRYVTGATPEEKWDILTVDLLNPGMQPHYFERRDDGTRTNCATCSSDGVLMEGECTPLLTQSSGYTHDKAVEIMRRTENQEQPAEAKA